MKNAKKSLSKKLYLLILSGLLFNPILGFAHNHTSEKSAEASQTLNIRNLVELPDNTLAGGQPSQEDLKLLSQQGIKTVVNFRGADEFEKFDEAKEVAANGMRYVHIPIDSKGALNKDNVAKFREALEASPSDTFLHCGSGNRVGALYALDAFWNQDKTAEEAIAIGQKAGLTSLKEHVESLLSEDTDASEGSN